MFNFKYFLVVTIFSINSQACIWYPANTPYWPSNRIPVCFTNADSDDRGEELSRSIRNALIEFNRRTPFNFYGFNSCSTLASGDPALSIALNSQITISQAHSEFQDGMSQRPNVTIATHANLSEEYILSQTVHEVLHMFGFQHDFPRDGKDFQPGGNVRESNLLINGPYDPESRMILGSADVAEESYVAGQLLSEGDVQCLNIIANRQFTSHPETQTGLEAYQEATVTPGNDSPEVEPLIEDRSAN